MLDPTLLAAASATLETVINKALDYDPATRRALRQHTGKSLAITIRELNTSLCFHLGDEIMVTNQSEGATVRLQGSLPALIRLAVSSSTNLADSDVEVWGSTALLIDIKQLARNMEIDWEEAINQWLGDVAGHQLAETLRRQLGWLNERRKSTERLLREFLTEELRATPSTAELESFNSQVDQLYLKTDRLQARVEKLRHQLADKLATSDSTQKPSP
ncbi:MAG: SCP2 sterol-binding domain-containing protein [Candidatus Pelagadaptatus aseana]|uniref:ubiquinone biosynthesis accessory factor UbiJ n=1 Tax=Candidatus Pelagadaptatus aseana TaxID=3120508 RepID=UPI0039B360F2